jgi:hypothetical protein
VVILVTAATVLLNRNSTTEQFTARPTEQNLHGPRLEIPDAPWEPSFFEALKQRTKVLDLPSLRTVILPDQDVEVRFWYDGFEVISGVIIRRSGHTWSGLWIHQVEDSKPTSVRKEQLGPPKSGWDVLWNNLVSAGILTLPDSSTAGCKTEVLDGMAYIIETNENGRYRTYWYGNPGYMHCPEAKRMVLLEEIIGTEFDLHKRTHRTEQ